MGDEEEMKRARRIVEDERGVGKAVWMVEAEKGHNAASSVRRESTEVKVRSGVSSEDGCI